MRLAFPSIGPGRRHRDPTQDGWKGYALIVPAIGLVLLIKGIPLLYGLSSSFQSGDSGPTLANYERMLADPVWLTALFNAARALLLLPVFILVPLVLALLLFLRVPGWRFFRAAFFLANLLPAAIVGLMFRVILGFDGPVVQVLSAAGLEALARPVLSNPDTALWAVFGVVLWTIFGLGVLVYLGGLAAIPEDLVDAARVDGAGFWPLLRRVMLPLVVPTMGYWAFVCTAELLLFNFPYVFALTGGGPGYSSMLPQLYIYQAFTLLFDPEYAATLGVTFGLIVTALSLVQVRMMFNRATAGSA